MKDFENLDKDRIDDVIVGNATPEAEQGLNMARMISLMGLNTEKVPGMTINRYCSSGLQSIALGHYQIQAGASNRYRLGDTTKCLPARWRIYYLK